MTSTPTISVRGAFLRGWQASARTRTYDLDSAEQRFERAHGTGTGTSFAAGWTAYAAGTYSTPSAAWAAMAEELTPAPAEDLTPAPSAADEAAVLVESRRMTPAPYSLPAAMVAILRDCESEIGAALATVATVDGVDL